jgi:homoserine kinase type II
MIREMVYPAKMGLFTILSLDEARRLGREFGVEVASVEPLQAGSVNSNYRITDATGARYFARVYEEQDVTGAEVELRLLGELSRAGIPTTPPIARREQAVASFRGKPFAMYPWIDGEILCQGRVEESHCERVGVALARIHAASARVSRLGEGRFRVEDIARRLERIERESTLHAQAASVIRQKLEHYSSRRNPELPKGVIHGDLFRDNVLWRGGEIAALIDFESASHGPFCFDLAVTVFAWCYGSAFSTPLVRALLRGYVGVRPLAAEEREGFVVEGALACLRFATTRITDFSMRAEPGQAPLRDYRRFLARLDELEAGMLDNELAAAGAS